MKPLVALSAAAVAAAAFAVPAAHAAPVAPGATAAAPQATPAATVKKVFTVFGKFTDRQTASYGAANGVGNLTVTRGTVSDSSGKNVGTLTTVIRVIAPSPKKDAELRDTQSSVTLKDGTIFAQAINEDPKDGPPKTLHIMPVVGGTGAYASARGTLIIYPMGDKYRMAYDLFVDKDLRPRTFSFDNVASASAAGDAPQGLGDLSMLRATGSAASYVLLATRAGDSGGVVTD
ncbi:MAG: allene oxide cyclase barrel-like domain-containing protein, partial [Candidatus Nanopelagicales bacterium]